MGIECSYIIEFVNKSHHGLVTLRLELVFCRNSIVIQLFQKLINLFEIALRVSGDIRQNIVPEVSGESQVLIRDLDMESLIIIVKPSSFHRLFAIRDISMLTESSLNSIISLDHDLPNVLLLKAPFMVLGDDLDSIGHLMGAYFLVLK